MRVELLTIGTELLLGFTIDSNAAFIARVLAEIGVEVVERATVGDDAEDIARAVREAMDRTGAVIATGGLGPTADDRTRPVIAALFGRELRRDEELLDRIAARFRVLGRTMPPSNAGQAMVPEGALVLENHQGSAPGLWLEDERGRWVAMLPGVPREMRAMLTEAVLPMLRARSTSDAGVPVVLSRTLRTTGIGESALAERLGPDLGTAVDDLPLAFLPGWEGVDLRLTARGLPREAATRALDAAGAKLYERAARYVYGEDGADLAAVVLDQCRERSLHVATAESCTGGLLGGRLTAIAGSSAVYLGGVVAYADAVKTSLLRVPPEELREHGAVSEPVVRRMATGARLGVGGEVGMAITGIAGPSGGTPEKPVGTVWMAVDVRGDVHAVRRVFTGDRDEIRHRATQGALDVLRRQLAGD